MSKYLLKTSECILAVLFRIYGSKKSRSDQEYPQETYARLLSTLRSIWLTSSPSILKIARRGLEQKEWDLWDV